MINYHHLNRYHKIVNYYKENLFDGYYEKHHIIPKCLGGVNSKDNLVLLPPRAHFICHYILYKAYPENKKLAHAFAMMAVNNKHQYRQSSSKLYELSKIARSSALKGVPRPEWVKERLRKPKSNKENYKGTKSKEHAESISRGLKGLKKTKEHIDNLRKSNEKHYKRRAAITKEKVKMYRKLYKKSNMSRKEFADFHGLNINTLKKYLRGL